jgi:hypothetical protein
MIKIKAGGTTLIIIILVLLEPVFSEHFRNQNDKDTTEEPEYHIKVRDGLPPKEGVFYMDQKSQQHCHTTRN